MPDDQGHESKIQVDLRESFSDFDRDVSRLDHVQEQAVRLGPVDQRVVDAGFE
jgi:hypothetical protein